MKVQIDLITMKEQRMTPLQDGGDCALFRCTDRYIYSADSSGKVESCLLCNSRNCRPVSQITARSPETLEHVNSILAHTAGVADFDVSGNKIITCGYSSRYAPAVLALPLSRQFQRWRHHHQRPLHQDL